jgi:hypothetical protein
LKGLLLQSDAKPPLCQLAVSEIDPKTSVCIVDDAGKIVREARVASEPEALLQVRHVSRQKLAGGS